MKNLLTVFVILLLSFVIGCGKSDKTDSKTEKKSDTKKEFVSGFACKIDGKDFFIPESSSYIKKDNKSFSIYAKIDVENGQYDDFFFYVEAPVNVGEYALTKENKPGHVQYNTNKEKATKGSSEYDAFWSENGKLILSKVDDKGIEGTFNFNATGSVNDVEKKIAITEGKIKVPFQ